MIGDLMNDTVYVAQTEIMIGRWIHRPGYPMPKCSICHEYSIDSLTGGKYCPHCGAFLNEANHDYDEESEVRT